MARNSKSQQEQRLLELLNSPVNKNKCGECKDHNPTWASWNLGVFLCGRCASAHRSLGKDISRVKSLSMENWSSQELSVLGKIGNKRNNKFWNEKNVPFPYDPDDKDSLIMWLRDKYTGRYRYGAVTDADYNLEDSWGAGTDDYGFDKSRRSSGGSNGLGRRMSSALGLNYVGQTRRQSQLASRAQNDDSYDDFSGMTKSMRRGIERNNPRNYENDYDNDYNDNYGGSRNGSAHSRYSSPSHSSSRPGSAASRPMRLTYRRPTESDYRKFGDQSRKMKFDMGYEDEDVNVEALSLARGNIDRAVEIIKQSGPKPADYSRSTSARNNASSSSASSKAVPSLPQRKEAAGSIFDSTKAGGFNWLDDSVAPTDASNKDNQIYQYVDPNTGSVYYIDANGQQYVDPSQLQTAPQQQMMDPFQLQQQPMAQTVMQTGFPQQSMATGFSQQAMATGVNVPASQLSMNQLAQQQQLQQQQLQQQQLQQQQLQQQQLQQQQLQQQQLQQQQLQQQQLQQQQIYQPNFYNGY